jgi:hypothetical protein
MSQFQASTSGDVSTALDDQLAQLKNHSTLPRFWNAAIKLPSFSFLSLIIFIPNRFTPAVPAAAVLAVPAAAASAAG